MYQFNAILDDFLFLEKSESREIHYTPEKFLFCELMQEIINNTRSVLKNGQHFEFTPCTPDVEVVHDKKILSIVFRNLFFNAVKYSGENTCVNIRVTASDYLTVQIEDEGIGIPEKDQKHIFERFFRAGNALTFQGTGIGLNIVKQHVDELGGSIGFKSQEGKGTVFTVKLPLKVVVATPMNFKN